MWLWQGARGKGQGAVSYQTHMARGIKKKERRDKSRLYIFFVGLPFNF